MPNSAATATDAGDIAARLAARATPGGLRYGSGGVGTAAHIAGATFASLQKLDAIHIPYRGSVELMPALLGGQMHGIGLFAVFILLHVVLIAEAHLHQCGIAVTVLAFPATMHQREVAFGDLVILERLLRAQQRLAALGEQQHARGIAVEPMAELDELVFLPGANQIGRAHV